MKRLIFSLLLTAGSLQAFAQQELIHPKEQQKQGLVQQEKPYIQVNGKPIAYPSMALLSPANIASMEVLKDEKATTKFGNKAKDGAILITLKPAAKLATIHDIYTHFGIPAAQHSLKVVINNQLVKDNSLILADLKQIEKVEAKTQDVTAPVRWSFDDEEEFLHITAKPQPKN